MDTDYLRDLADLVLRMLHVVAGIAWIGASFYFIRLDLGLAPPKEPKEGVAGEYWGVHGGGFYHSQKIQGRAAEAARAPALVQVGGVHDLALRLRTARRPLLVGRRHQARRSRRRDLDSWQAVGLSAAGLALAWLVYDLACRLLIEDRLVAVAVAALVTVSAYAAGELFSARASYLQVGAMLGTIMAANVFFVIIPAHRELVRAKQEGREPNPLPGLARAAVVHNNYLTLPVVFAMLAGHFPLTFGSDHAWLVLHDLRNAPRSGTSSTAGTRAGGTGGSSARPAWPPWPLRSCSRRTTSPRRRSRRMPWRRASSPSAARPATREHPHRSASSSRRWRRWSSKQTRSHARCRRGRCRLGTRPG